MAVLSIGSLNLDYVYSVPHFVQPGESLIATETAVKAGGKGLNQALALARAGLSVAHVGCIGHEGKVLRELLVANGVDTTRVEEVEVAQGTAFIQVDGKGQNCIVVYPGSNQALTEAQVDEALGKLDADDYVVMQNETSCVAHILDECARRQLRVVFNPAPYSADIAAMDLSAVTWLVVNETEAAGLTGSADPDEAWTVLHDTWPHLGLVVTLGSKGSVAFTGDKRKKQAAYAVETVDTTAAGDTFIGYFVAGLVDGLSLSTCLRQASCAAALACTRPGAAPSIPLAHELRALMENE